MIRKAVVSDALRIAEIPIFTKRMNYRGTFKNNKVSNKQIKAGNSQ